MAENANPADAPEISWYVIARKGGLTVRVRPGMSIGEDESGEMSILPGDALVVVDVSDNGSLVLHPASTTHEFVTMQSRRTRAVEIDAGLRAQVFTPNSVIAFDTDIAKPANTTMRVELVEALSVEEAVAKQPTADVTGFETSAAPAPAKVPAKAKYTDKDTARKAPVSRKRAAKEQAANVPGRHTASIAQDRQPAAQTQSGESSAVTQPAANEAAKTRATTRNKPARAAGKRSVTKAQRASTATGKETAGNATEKKARTATETKARTAGKRKATGAKGSKAAPRTTAATKKAADKEPSHAKRAARQRAAAPPARSKKPGPRRDPAGAVRHRSRRLLARARQIIERTRERRRPAGKRMSRARITALAASILLAGFISSRFAHDFSPLAAVRMALPTPVASYGSGLQPSGAPAPSLNNVAVEPAEDSLDVTVQWIQAGWNDIAQDLTDGARDYHHRAEQAVSEFLNPADRGANHAPAVSRTSPREVGPSPTGTATTTGQTSPEKTTGRTRETGVSHALSPEATDARSAKEHRVVRVVAPPAETDTPQSEPVSEDRPATPFRETSAEVSRPWVKIATPLEVAHVEVGQPQSTLHDRDAPAAKIDVRLSSDRVTGGWQVREMKPVHPERP